MEDIPLYVLLAVLIALLIISALFSLSETSMMAVNRHRLKYLETQGHHGAHLTIQLLAKTDRLLGVILLGNNLVNSAAATLVAIIISISFDHSDLALFIGTLCVTFVILIFSEITPKIIAATYPEPIALASSYLLTPLLKLFYPIVWFINLFVQALLFVLQLQPKENNLAHRINPEELRALVLEAGHFIQKSHQSILLNLLDLETISVNDVMLPRGKIEAIDLNNGDEIQNQLLTCRHTRLPIYRGTLNNIIGIVHVRKVLNQMGSGKITSSKLEEIMHKPHFILSGTLLLSQLQLFQENQERFGLIVDEYGKWMGIITLEDILREIIGEFTTQLPSQADSFIKQEDGSVLVDGSTLLRDLNRKLGLKFSLRGPKTLNGLIINHFQDTPNAGTNCKISGYPMEIIRTQDLAIKIVKIFLTKT